MTDSVAISGAPPWAYAIWTDPNNIFLEIASKSGTPYITKYPRGTAGMAKALETLTNAHDAMNKAKTRYQVPVQRVTKVAAGKTGTPSQHDYSMTDPEAQTEISNYRAHRFGITRLSTGEYVLFDPSGEVLAIGGLSIIKAWIKTGPEHYETCVDNYTARSRHEANQGRELLTQLGLGLVEPPQPIVRRF